MSEKKEFIDNVLYFKNYVIKSVRKILQNEYDIDDEKIEAILSYVEEPLFKLILNHYSLLVNEIKRIALRVDREFEFDGEKLYEILEERGWFDNYE